MFILRNRYIWLADLGLLSLTPLLALSLRVYLPWGSHYNEPLLFFVFLSLIVKFPIFYAFRLYSRYWSYASIDEMISIIMAVLTASAMVTGIHYGLQGSGLMPGGGLPRSIPVIDGMLTLLAVGSVRFSIRALEYYWQFRDPKKRKRFKRVLVVGAGAAGEMVVREMRTSRMVALEPVGFVDDNPMKSGAVIHGVRVLGTLSQIPELVKNYKIEEVVIAMPTAPGNIIRQAVKMCDEAGVPSKSVPGIYELLNERASISRIRDVKIEDLLRREPVSIDTGRVEQMIAGKRVLVSGAGGSIGTELCLQIAGFHPAQMILVGHGENSLFNLAFELKKSGLDKVPLKMVLADLRDRPRMENVFDRYHPEIVFHAAAHKHVPLTEENVEDAITNNVVGTWNLVELARLHDVERFVLISTDKAVNPVNVLGMTKRIAELIVRDAAIQTHKPYVSVRFGNVLGSRGSVVPYFQKQIAEGGPVTVTHPEMRRFFMTIPEAVQLVLQAATLGNQGEVFVLDMGEPVRIVDLARDMIELSGYKVGTDIEIIYTGLRPGEKLYEELFTEDENPERTEHDKVFVACNGAALDSEWLRTQINELIALSQSGNVPAARSMLSRIITTKPGIVPQPLPAAQFQRRP